MTYIFRNIEPELYGFVKSSDEHKDVLLVEGARQVGKTTVVEHVISRFPDRTTIINLEKDRLFRLKIDECKQFSEFEDLLRISFGFDPTAGGILFIDESQESMVLGRFVRFMKESWPRTTTILSGSTLARLFRKDVRYPVGRVKRLMVSPFSFCEFLRAGKNDFLVEKLNTPSQISTIVHKELILNLDKYLEVGGLPAVVMEYFLDRDFRQLRSGVIADYEQDFIRLFGEDDLSIVKGCFRSVANYVGSPSKNSSVIPSPTTPVHHKINQVFTRLEQWKLILCSEQRGVSPEHSHRYLPKRYLFDTGILRHYREAAIPSISLIDSINPDLRKPLGGIAENQVAIELARKTSGLHGWKKSPSGMEIDFILQRGDDIVPIECKTATRIKKTHLKGILSYLRMYDQKKGVVVSLSPYEHIDYDGGFEVVNIPLYMAESIWDLV
ncbi:AAA family ATPase [Desulfobacula sp.]|uniref:ATP-binding protein n=1 Tax=Desulfobacula sp. TaxID=2593537 RepID=UPI00261C95D0|nr:AAA family ATPase [Desulfobacula sp.]